MDDELRETLGDNLHGGSEEQPVSRRRGNKASMQCAWTLHHAVDRARRSSLGRRSCDEDMMKCNGTEG